ncbi:MAG: hypothetical protein F4078_00020 [Acidimicrobiia bacterium]|nr:hypothetical protein [Acidimicrobiia bacterium]
MTTSDQKTAFLFSKLAEHTDEETAAALMERLPPDWSQLATKSDVAALGAELRGEMAEMRGGMAALGAELRGEMAELRGEMAELRGGMAALGAELRGEMAALSADLGGGITALAGDMVAMEGRSERRAARDLRTVLFAFAGFALAVMAMFVTLMVAGVPTA